jgi:hypothetical protein
MEIQEYALDIQHVSGTKNFLADAISRNPAGLIEAAIRDLSRPRGIVIAKIDLCIDTSVGRKLKNTATWQQQDPTLCDRIDFIKFCQGQTEGRYLVRNDTPYCRDSKTYQY